MVNIRIPFIVLSLFMATAVVAEQKVTQGHFELHYNTFPSTFLAKEIANTYQITRSKNRGIVSISVLDKSSNPPLALEAKITISAKNLLNQTKEIKLHKITEENQAVYYLGSFALNNQEDVNFSITAQPNGSDEKLSVQFSREFYTD
ncbi:DUF4426 domain-containing protein [Marinicella meishanensis]|uniref:DUF4426 domain-containing protein n=1 Tax=Marinicella meishanensis TaxID=2873263 RepID=UPI001CBAE3B5|nr:DUF4426 domain-containing protein [Marinicella sp. NBU2979]